MNKIGNKIIVIGLPGSGKSTFSKELHNITKLPLYHLDNIFWKADRTNISREEFDLKLGEILKEDSFIIDGLYHRTMEVRMQASDTIIFLDYPLELCLEGVKARVGTKRTDIPWVEETLDPEFVQYIINSNDTGLAKIKNLLDKYKDKKIVIFKTREEANDFLNNLQ